jgi:probable HAF family extracellular repeat protein
MRAVFALCASVAFLGVVPEAYSQNHYVGFLYENGTYTAISDPLGVDTYALGINNSGQIVGAYENSKSQLFGYVYQNGTYFVQGAGFILLNPDADQTDARYHAASRARTGSPRQ